MALSESTRQRIDDLLSGHRVVLFMKGTRNAPRCGFSATAVGILNELVDDYVSVDVLADDDIRQGIKDYSNWPICSGSPGRTAAHRRSRSPTPPRRRSASAWRTIRAWRCTLPSTAAGRRSSC
jgi:hypothetical protein